MQRIDVFSVISPGLLTTFQDLGRTGYQGAGVPQAGAVDPAALQIANRLTGNPPDAACLELTMLGPTLEAIAPTAVALTGADLGARLNGEPAPLWKSFQVRPGDRLSFTGPKAGCRAYLAVAGGFDAPLTLGSRSTDLLGQLGPPPLKAGDVLTAGANAAPPDALIGRQLPLPLRPAYTNVAVVRAVPGPQYDRFHPEALDMLASATYTVSPRSDRIGCRLDGPPLAHRAGADIVSDPIPLGAIQVPPDGQPIVLLQGRQTMGGYTKIGVVISPDTPALAQLPPGGRVRFQWISRAEAHAAHTVARDRLQQMLTAITR